MPAVGEVAEGRAAARGGALRVAAYLGGQLLTVGAVALLFRHLGVADTGRWVTVLSLVAIVQGLTDLGLTTLGTRELAVAPPERRGALVAELLGLRLVATVLGVGVVALFAAVAGYGGRMVLGVGLAGAALVVQNAATTLGLELLAGLRAGWMAAADLLRQAVAAVLIVVLVAAGAGLDWFFAALVPAAACALALTVAARARAGRSPAAATANHTDPRALPAPALAPARWRELLRRTVPFAVAAAASVLFFRVAVVEMSLLASPRDTGLFAAAFRVVEVLAALPALAVSAAFPVFSRAAHGGEAARLAAAVRRTLEACAELGGAIALGLALGAPAVVTVVAGDGFGGAVPVLRVLGLALLGSFLAAPPAFALLGLGRERALMWCNVVGLALAAGAAAALIEADGAVGAAIAVVLGEWGLAAVFTVLARRALRPAPASLVRVLAAGAVGAAAALVPGLPSWATALLGLATYAAVLRALGGLGGLAALRVKAS